jgi:hypothetical protein
MAIEKFFLSVQDVANDLGIRTLDAKELICRLNKMLELDGRKAIIQDMINKSFYEEVKATGFMYRPEHYEVPIEKRLWWSLEEFVQMCDGAMSRDRAKKHLEEIGLLRRNGKKQIVNRLAYEKWCRKNF